MSPFAAGPSYISKGMLIVFDVWFAMGIVIHFRDTEEMTKVFTWILIVAAISSVFVIAEYNKLQWAYDIWVKLHSESGLYNFRRFRPGGLTLGPIECSYQLAVVMPICLFELIFDKNGSNKKLNCGYAIKLPKFLSLLGIVLCIIAVWLNQSRSTIIATTIVALCYIISFLKDKKSSQINKMKLGLIIFAIVVLLVFNLSINEIFESSRFAESESAGTRVPLFLTALNHFIHNPIGYGVYQHNPRYFVGDESVYQAISTDYAHNMFANCLVCYGVVGFLYLVLLIRKSVVSLRRIRTMNENCYRVLGGMLLSYLINAQFHNAYFFSGDVISWCIVGMIFAGAANASEEYVKER